MFPVLLWTICKARSGLFLLNTLVASHETMKDCESMNSVNSSEYSMYCPVLTSHYGSTTACEYHFMLTSRQLHEDSFYTALMRAFTCSRKFPTSHFWSFVLGKNWNRGGRQVYSCLFIGKILIKSKWYVASHSLTTI